MTGEEMQFISPDRERYKSQLDAAQAEVARLREVNAELLKACESFVAAWSITDVFKGANAMQEAVIQADAAIRKSRGTPAPPAGEQ